MLSLKEIKEKAESLKIAKKPKEEPLSALQIGFQVESRFDIAKRNIRKKYRFFIDELKYNGFFSDFWMWNFIFLNLFLAFLFYYQINIAFGILPESIGLNIDFDRNYDFLISKSLLYIIPSFHVLISFLIILINIKSQRRLSHLFTSSFFHFLIIGIFEFYALVGLLRYFS